MFAPTLMLVSLAFVLGGCPDDGSDAAAGSAGSSGTSGSAGSSGTAGTGGTAGMGTESFSGSFGCGDKHEYPFDATSSEVYELEVSWSVDPTAGSGANPGCVLNDANGPVQENGVDIGFGGDLYPNYGVVNDKRLYNFRKDGGYKWVCGNELACATVTFTLTNTRLVGAAANRTKAGAEVIQVDYGKPNTGTVGCEESRYFTFDAAAGATYELSLGGQRFAGATGVGSAQIALLDSTDQPIQDAGSDVTVSFAFDDMINTTEKRQITIADAGTYQLVLSYWNGCTLGNYEVMVSSVP